MFRTLIVSLALCLIASRAVSLPIEGHESRENELLKRLLDVLAAKEDRRATGGRIDHAHHSGSAHHALHDTVAMDDAVAKAMELTNETDTLMLVTADHSHTLSVGGYPPRGRPILGTGTLREGEMMEDGLPFTTLAYAAGPGGREEQKSYQDTGMRRNLTDVDTEDPNFLQPAVVPLVSSPHAGEDVAIYANGPMSHLFNGVHEQHYIAHVVRYAARLDETQCPRPVTPGNGAPSAGFDLPLTLIASVTLAAYYTVKKI